MAPSVRVMIGDKIATPVILTFLRDPRVGKMFSLAPRVEQFSLGGVMVGEEKDDSEGENGRPGEP